MKKLTPLEKRLLQGIQSKIDKKTPLTSYEIEVYDLIKGEIETDEKKESLADRTRRVFMTFMFLLGIASCFIIYYEFKYPPQMAIVKK